MPIDIWIVTTDDDNGTVHYGPYYSKKDADDHATRYCAEQWKRSLMAEDMPDDWQEAYDILMDRSGTSYISVEWFPVLTEAERRVQDLRGAVENLLTQVQQMEGMFDDADGAIANAVQDAELVLAAGVEVSDGN